MPQVDASSVTQNLHELFRLEREADKLRALILLSPHDAVLEALGAAIREAQQQVDETSSVLALTAIATLLGHLQGPDVVDMLIGLLATDDPDVRHVAGAALEHMAFDRFKEVAIGIERALAHLPNDNPALRELPFVLVEVPEPGVTKLLQKFLAHPEAEVVAAAMEACLEMGDEALVPAIARLKGDSRTVELNDEEAEENDEPVLATIGELAQEAQELLSHGHDGSHGCGAPSTEPSEASHSKPARQDPKQAASQPVPQRHSAGSQSATSSHTQPANARLPEPAPASPRRSAPEPQPSPQRPTDRRQAKPEERGRGRPGGGGRR